MFDYSRKPVKWQVGNFSYFKRPTGNIQCAEYCGDSEVCRVSCQTADFLSRKGAKHAMICACVVSVAVFAPVPDIKSFMRGSGFSY